MIFPVEIMVVHADIEKDPLRKAIPCLTTGFRASAPSDTHSVAQTHDLHSSELLEVDDVRFSGAIIFCVKGKNK
jgi:hypothetical protein